MTPDVTIVVVPRDRFSSVLDCARSILQHTSQPMRLAFLDFGYPPQVLEKLREICKDVPTEIIPCGRTIPMLALRDFLPKVTTRYLVWVDNDTYMTPGWLTALLDLNRPEAEGGLGARVILPVTLEREGLDVDQRQIPLRNHISHAELRSVRVDGREFVFDHKPFRRAAPEELPQEPHTIDFFELHTFFAETDVLRQLDLPAMVVREHIDIGIQLHKLGIDIWCQPKSHVHFDNIHERPTWRDLKFFFFRWSRRLVDQSHRLFRERWGMTFFNEQYMCNWAFRRKVYSVARFAFLPQKPADLLSRIMVRLFRPAIPAAHRGNPLAESALVLRRGEAAVPETARS